MLNAKMNKPLRELGIKSIFHRGGTLPRMDRLYIIKFWIDGSEPYQLHERKVYTLKNLDKTIQKIKKSNKNYSYELYIITQGELEQIKYNRR